MLPPAPLCLPFWKLGTQKKSNTHRTLSLKFCRYEKSDLTCTILLCQPNYCWLVVSRLNCIFQRVTVAMKKINFESTYIRFISTMTFCLHPHILEQCRCPKYALLSFLNETHKLERGLKQEEAVHLLVFVSPFDLR